MNSTTQTRRGFVSGVTAGMGMLLGGCNRAAPETPAPPDSAPADVTLRIGPVLVDIAKDHTISTIGYNGSVPGPLIRLREGVPVTVDLFNDTDAPELVHWHGQIIPADVDGAAEEKSLVVPAHGHLRYRLTPQPAGARWVHSHVMAMSDLSRGTYTGQFGFVYVEPKSQPGAYDQEIFLATHEWEPFYTRRKKAEEMDAEQKARMAAAEEGRKAERLGDRLSALHHQRQVPRLRRAGSREGRAARPVSLPECERHGEHPARVAGPQFQVVALDGNPVPHPQAGGSARTGNRRADRRGGRNEESRRLDSGNSQGRRSPGRHGDRGRVRQQDRPAALDQACRSNVGLHALRRQSHGSGSRRSDSAGVRKDQRRHGRLQPVDHQRQGLRREGRAARSCTRASATAWSSTIRPTTRIRFICIATASS